MTTTNLERSWTHPERAAEHSLKKPGPWDREPDKVQWVDQATGLDCLAVRNHMGNWCGYVGVPPGHPAFGCTYGGEPLDEINVHGGLTFADSCDEHATEGHGICHVPFAGRPADVWWLGFDCGHGMDLIPGMVDVEERLGLKPIPTPAGYEPRYRDLGYVRHECESLARQLAEIGAGESPLSR